MTAILPYLRTRDGVFQYERRVPTHIQRNPSWFAQSFEHRPLYRRSLKTKRRADALAAYEAIDRDFEQRAARWTGAAPRVEITRSPPRRTLTDQDLDAIAHHYANLVAEPFEKLHRRANVCDSAAAELARMESDLEIDAESIQANLKARVPDAASLILQPVAEAAIVATNQGYDAPEGSEYRSAIIGAIRSGQERGYKRVAALSGGEVLPKLATVAAPRKSLNPMTLADAIDCYFEARKPPVKIISETRLALKKFEQVVGCKSLAAVTKDDAHRFLQGLSDQQVGGKTPGSVVRYLSEATIRKRLWMLTAPINHARGRGLFDGENVLNGLNASLYARATDKAAMPTKRRLQVSELNLIFAHPWFTGCASATNTHTPGAHRLNGAEFWVPIVALYTGCRAAELGGLKISEVQLNDPCPHIIIRDNEYRRTKSKRTRCVPILDALVAIGFPSYVEHIRRCGHDRLFPDWLASKRKGGGENDFPAWSNGAVIRAFNRTVIPSALGEKLASGARREVTFHSLRGAFKAMLATSNRVTPVLVDEVIGHSQGDLDNRYIGEVTIEETYPVMRSCNYMGLNIPNNINLSTSA